MRSVNCIRVPDKPSADDLDAIGLGCDKVDESRYGLLVLDELGSWLNSRDWNAEGRKELIEWLIHSRKKRWDVIFIVQSDSMMDKQVREALLEYLVNCKRLDKVKVPVFGWIGKWLTLGAWNGCVGRLHLGVVLYAGGSSVAANALIVDRWFYRGNDLFECYDTEQVFSSSYASGVFSYLTPWHTVGRYLKASRWQNFVKDFRLWFGFDLAPRTRHRPDPRLYPLLRLPAEVRWLAARHLVSAGFL